MAQVLDIPRFEQSLIDNGRLKSTAEQYGRIMKQFSAWERDEGLDISRRLALWLSEARNHLSPATLAQRRSAINSWLHHALTDLGEDVDTEVLKTYRMPPPRPPQPHPLPDGIFAIRAMLKVAGELYGPDARGIIALGGLGGLRISESLKMRRENIHGNRGYVPRRIEMEVCGKGGHFRMIPVSRELDDELSKLPESGRLIRLEEARARELVRLTAVHACVKGKYRDGVSSHDLRATFATEVYRKTKDIVLVQMLLGHADVKTTQRYIGVSVEQMHSGVDLSQVGGVYDE